MPHIPYARGFIERDLSATSLWSQSTRAQVDLTETDEHPKCITSAGIDPYLSSSGASSSSDVQPSRDLDFVNMHDIARLAEHFLGCPIVLQNLCPAAKFSSNMRSVPDARLYLQPPPHLLPHSRNVAAVHLRGYGTLFGIGRTPTVTMVKYGTCALVCLVHLYGSSDVSLPPIHRPGG